jgi:hypothetical protein
VRICFSCMKEAGGWVCIPVSQDWDRILAVFSRGLLLTLAGVGISGLTPLSISLIHQVGIITVGLNALSIFLFFPETQYFRRDGITDVGSSRGSDEKVNSTPEVVQVSSPSKKTFLQELKPWSPINRRANPLELFLRPWPMIVYPATIFGFLSYSAALAWLLCVVNTNASIFQAPPYNFKPGINGLINIPGTIGVLAGSFCGGALTDNFAEWMARRNNGVYEPETRLLGLVIPFFVVPIGLLMYLCKLPARLTTRYGIGVQHQTHWIVPYIGYGFVNFAIASVPAIGMTYSNFYYFDFAKFSHRRLLPSCV